MSEELVEALRRLSEELIGKPREIVLREIVPGLAGYENIVGVAIDEKIKRGKSTGRLCLKVYVKRYT